jgi:hypothetical protein
MFQLWETGRINYARCQACRTKGRIGPNNNRKTTSNQTQLDLSKLCISSVGVMPLQNGIQ